jgi:transketolase
MEGISGKGGGIAGHLKPSNLRQSCDTYRIDFDAVARLAFSEVVSSRFQGYRWNVLDVANAGRDHWATAMCGLVAGGGLNAG